MPAGPRRSARASADLVHARSHIEKLLADVPSHCGIVTVLDGHPATLAWLGAVHGHRVRPLGVEHFGQTGSIPDLYRHYGIDANAIVAAAAALTPGRPDPAPEDIAVILPHRVVQLPSQCAAGHIARELVPPVDVRRTVEQTYRARRLNLLLPPAICRSRRPARPRR